MKSFQGVFHTIGRCRYIGAGPAQPFQLGADCFLGLMKRKKTIEDFGCWLLVHLPALETLDLSLAYLPSSLTPLCHLRHLRLHALAPSAKQGSAQLWENLQA